MTLTGQTELELPEDRLKELAQPIPDIVAGAEKVVSDALHGGLGAIPGEQVIEDAGKAAESAFGFFSGIASHIPGVGGGGIQSPGYDARGGGR